MKKMKKMVLIIMAVSMIGALGISSALASGFVCDVLGTGTSGAQAFIKLSDRATPPAFTNQFYILDPANQNQLLATALTAATSGIKAQVVFVGTGTPPAFTTVTSVIMETN